MALAAPERMLLLIHTKRFGRAGTRRLRYQARKRYSTPQAKSFGYNEATKPQVVMLYLEGVSLRGVARVLCVGNVSVLNRVNRQTQDLPQQVNATNPTVVETE